MSTKRTGGVDRAVRWRLAQVRDGRPAPLRLWLCRLKGAVLGMTLLAVWSPHAAGAEDLPSLLKPLLAVGGEGAGSQKAAQAWDALTSGDAARLPLLFEALDHAGPLSANWIRTAIDAVAERAIRDGGKLPAAELERFLSETKHAPRARRLAYEWILRVDPAARQRWLDRLLDDPSVELRRDAVAELIRQAEELKEGPRAPEVLGLYQRALGASRDLDQAELLAERLGKLGHPVDLNRHFGFLLRWRIIGPFDNTKQSGFDAVYPPEEEIAFEKTYQGKLGNVGWRDCETKEKYGKVDLNAFLSEQKGVCAYAAAAFFSPAERPVELRVQMTNAGKVWLNGKLLSAHNIYHAGDFFDQYVAAASLRSGENLVLVKVCQNEQTDSWARGWQFALRVCDSAGGAVLSAEPAQEKGRPSPTSGDSQ